MIQLEYDDNREWTHESHHNTSSIIPHDNTATACLPIGGALATRRTETTASDVFLFLEINATTFFFSFDKQQIEILC
jgi:hypothetical protein